MIFWLGVSLVFGWEGEEEEEEDDEEGSRRAMQRAVARPLC